MNDEQQDDDKSKTQIKEEMQALKQLGEALLELPPSVYQSFPIPEKLDDAITVAKKIRSRSALKRQIQYIGRIMRDVESAPIEEAYNEWKNGRKKLTREHHALEQLRDDLIEQQAGALETFINTHPNTNIQQLRQLIRLSQKEKQANKPPKNYRKLFQFIKAATLEQNNH